MGRLTYVKIAKQIINIPNYWRQSSFIFAAVTSQLAIQVENRSVYLSLLSFIFATGQAAGLHINFAPSADKIDAPDW